jgi:hypothetical protein
VQEDVTAGTVPPREEAERVGRDVAKSRHARGDAEGHEVGEAVELHAEFAGRAEHARCGAVELVEQNTQNDEPTGIDELTLGRPEGGHHPYQQGEGGDCVWNNVTPARHALIAVLDHR